MDTEKLALPGMPGDLAGVVRVHHGGRVHRASPYASAAAPGSAAVAAEEEEEEEEEDGEEERRGDGWGRPRPRRRHRLRECHRDLCRSAGDQWEAGGGRGARRRAVSR